MLGSEETLVQALAALRDRDPVMARLHEDGILPGVRRHPPGLAGLAWIVVGQQVSTASAEAIWGRLKARMPAFSAEVLLAASDETLRGAGLSAPKIRTMRALAEAVAAGRLPLDDLATMEADEARGHLMAIKGIGPWTADVYLLFCLGHPDTFPAGDLALQEAVRLAYDLPERPDAKVLAAFSERWRPWRGAAALTLWVLYRRFKGRKGAPTAELAG